MVRSRGRRASSQFDVALTFVALVGAFLVGSVVRSLWLYPPN